MQELCQIRHSVFLLESEAPQPSSKRFVIPYTELERGGGNSQEKENGSFALFTAVKLSMVRNFHVNLGKE